MLDTPSKYAICTTLKTIIQKIEKKEPQSQNLQTQVENIKNRLFRAIPMRDAQITDGYGEFIVVNSGGKVDRKTHETAYRIFIQHRDEKNRTELIHRDLQKFNKNLKAIFIPRTLYELTLVKDQMENSTLTNPGDRFPKYEGKYKIPDFIDAGDSYDASVIEIAYGVNQVFENVFTEMKKGGDTSFSGKEISALLEDKIYFLSDCISTSEKINKASKEGVMIASCFTQAQYTGLYNERRIQMVRNMTALECSEAARHAFLLCRGSFYAKDSMIDDAKKCVTLSYGTSFFAGIERDPGATAFCFMGSIYRQTTDAYALVVPKENAESSPFFIPKTHSICQLGGRGEKFHATTLNPKDMVGRVLSAAIRDNSFHPGAVSNKTLKELDDNFREYKSKAILLTPPV